MTQNRPQPNTSEREPDASVFARPDFLKDRKAFAEKVAREGAVRMQVPASKPEVSNG